MSKDELLSILITSKSIKNNRKDLFKSNREEIKKSLYKPIRKNIFKSKEIRN